MFDFYKDFVGKDVNEKILKGVTSDFLQQATSATSKEQILQQATGHFK